MASAIAVVALLVLDRPRALAVPLEAGSGAPAAGIDRTVRGASFDTADLVTGVRGGLARPVFDARAGVLAAGGIQAAGVPDTLTGGYSVPPPVRDIRSSSVMVADTLSGGSAPSVSGSYASTGAVAISASGTAARTDQGYLARSAVRASEPGADGAAVSDMLTKSSVYRTGGSGGAAAPAAAFSGSLATVQVAGSLTAYQAMQAAAPKLSPASSTLETFTVGDKAGTTRLELPLEVRNTSIGFLNSSLTVFADDSGAFSSVGQSFNGLTSLDIAEPASAAVMAMGLAGIAVIRRRRRRR